MAGHGVDSSNNPISGATVQLIGGNTGTTDAHGDLLMPVSSARAHTLTASAAVQTTVARYHVHVQATGSTVLEFQLG
jgi:hypothetical protein